MARSAATSRSRERAFTRRLETESDLVADRLTRRHREVVESDRTFAPSRRMPGKELVPGPDTDVVAGSRGVLDRLVHDVLGLVLPTLMGEQPRHPVGLDAGEFRNRQPPAKA